jgi:hypothetical protein
VQKRKGERKEMKRKKRKEKKIGERISTYQGL